MNKTFWKNKKVLVTGHTGFKGTWLSQLLLLLGADVYGYALAPNTSPAIHSLLQLEIEEKIADIRDHATLEKFILAIKPDIIIHMAAQPLVRYSYQNPIETYEVNVMGTANLLNITRLCDSVKVVVNVTTDKVYENKEWAWSYRENDILGGYDPYSNSKACAELVTSAFRQSYFNMEEFDKHGKAIASARAGNVIGGGDWSVDRLIPDIIRSFISNKEVIIRNPSAIRPWQHVLEPITGYLLLAEKMWENPKKFAEAWNFGPKQEDCKSVGFIVEKMISLWGSGSLSTDKTEQPHEANFLKLDIAKAEMNLQWHPKWHIDKALEMTIEWYKKYYHDGNVVDITLKQINEYIK